jgi:ATP-dependent Clp protease ATP-binding subunit ClpA
VFERFTDRARRVIVLAQEEARMLNHDHIGTEHILLGLIHEGEGLAAQVLQRLGASTSRVRDAVMLQLSQPRHAEAAGPEEKPPGLFDDRERMVLTLMIDGHTKTQIGEILGVATVDDIVESIIKKLREAAA